MRIFAIALLLAASARAADVTVQWAPVTEREDGSLIDTGQVAYYVYYDYGEGFVQGEMAPPGSSEMTLYDVYPTCYDIFMKSFDVESGLYSEPSEIKRICVSGDEPPQPGESEPTSPRPPTYIIIITGVN